MANLIGTYIPFMKNLISIGASEAIDVNTGDIYEVQAKEVSGKVFFSAGKEPLAKVEFGMVMSRPRDLSDKKSLRNWANFIRKNSNLPLV